MICSFTSQYISSTKYPETLFEANNAIFPPIDTNAPFASGNTPSIPDMFNNIFFPSSFRVTSINPCILPSLLTAALRFPLLGCLFDLARFRLAYPTFRGNITIVILITIVIIIHKIVFVNYYCNFFYFFLFRTVLKIFFPLS